MTSAPLTPEDALVIDAVIERLLSVRRARPRTEVDLLDEDIVAVCRTARRVFLAQPMLLELNAPICVCGDIHGQFFDLIRIFEMNSFPSKEGGGYLFLGDYVDRAAQSIETIVLLLCYKLKFQDTFFLLRGNHECSTLNRIYGFFDECKRRYSVRLWRIFGDCFNCMPVAASGTLSGHMAPYFLRRPIHLADSLLRTSLFRSNFLRSIRQDLLLPRRTQSRARQPRAHP